MRAWIRRIKQGLFCYCCGESHTDCLEFHHTDPRDKEITLGKAISHGYGKPRILAEIAKCDVLCSNCHSVLHSMEEDNPR